MKYCMFSFCVKENKALSEHQFFLLCYLPNTHCATTTTIMYYRTESDACKHYYTTSLFNYMINVSIP